MDGLAAWHWIWYGPILMLVLVDVESYTIPHAWYIGALAWKRWDFVGAAVSPSAYVCWSAIIASIILPVHLLFLATILLFHADRRGQTFHRIVPIAVIGGVLLLPFVTDFVIWGSFPFGSSRLRLMPFLPWPGVPYGAF